MEKVRGRLRRIRNRIEQLPACWKPKKDMPKLIYTVMDNRECDSLLYHNNGVSEMRPGVVVHDQRGGEEFIRELIFWDKEDGCEKGDVLWSVPNDREGPTVRVATFNVALFALAPAIPPDHPCAASADSLSQSTPAHYLASESSSIFSCKSKSSSSDASSGLTSSTISRESSDSSEACAILSSASKPTQTFNVTSQVPKPSQIFDLSKVWKSSPLAAKTRNMCNFKPGGRSINGPFYHSKLNPVFSLSSSSSKSLMESLPCLFSDKLQCPSRASPVLNCSPEEGVQLCYTPVESRFDKSYESPLPLLQGTVIRPDVKRELIFQPDTINLSSVLMSGTSSPAPYTQIGQSPHFSSPSPSPSPPIGMSYVSSPSSSLLAPSNVDSPGNSCFSPSIASPCSNLSSGEADPRAPKKGTGVTSILDILLEVDADIIALQEVRAEEERGMKPLSELAEALGMEYAFAESWAPDFGNAVLSRWPIKSASVQQIHDETDYRNVLKVVVEVPLAGDLHFYCTQLDHLDEDWRMKQVDSLSSMLPPNQPHILTGNLNALDQLDYSKQRWEEITRLREKSRKLPPRGDVMKKLLQEKGYRDAKTSQEEVKSKTQMRENGQGAQGTCQHRTRVDYILGSSKLPFNFIPGSYSVVSSRGTSNHDLVMADLLPSFHGRDYQS